MSSCLHESSMLEKSSKFAFLSCSCTAATIACRWSSSVWKAITITIFISSSISSSNKKESSRSNLQIGSWHQCECFHVFTDGTYLSISKVSANCHSFMLSQRAVSKPFQDTPVFGRRKWIRLISQLACHKTNTYFHYLLRFGQVQGRSTGSLSRVSSW